MSTLSTQQRDGPRPPRRVEPCRVGIVVAVPSGDTVTLLEPERATPGQAPPTLTLTLTGVRAPMLGKRFIRDGKTTVERDERWAWDSREQLRQRVIGRSVVFRVQVRLTSSSPLMLRVWTIADQSHPSRTDFPLSTLLVPEATVSSGLTKCQSATPLLRRVGST